MSALITRSAWGARHPGGWADRRRTLPIRAAGPGGGVWLHHTVTAAPPPGATLAQDVAAVRTLENIGQQRFGGGISYTFVVTPSGRLFAGHLIERKGAHTVGHNLAGASIALIGNYERTAPTDAAVRAVAACLRLMVARGWLDTPRLRGGHRDAPGSATACPGDRAHALIGQINTLAAGSAPAPAPPPPRPRPIPDPAVRTLQRRLNTLGDLYGLAAPLDVDGLTGPRTRAAVTAYQRAAGITADGIAGPITTRHLENDMSMLDKITADVAAIRAEQREHRGRLSRIENNGPRATASAVWNHRVPFINGTSLHRIFGKDFRAGALLGNAAAERVESPARDRSTVSTILSALGKPAPAAAAAAPTAEDTADEGK